VTPAFYDNPGAQSPSGDPINVASGHPDDERHQRHRPPLGISVHDHIIVGKNGHARLEGLKLIPLASSTTARDATIWLF
jgi:hypothetical protein